jgi:hypothetical protein
MRIDRMMLKGGGLWSGINIYMLGIDPIEQDKVQDLVLPSDHFGLQAVVSRRAQ